MIEAGNISSDLVGCSFKNVEWYMPLFNLSNFVECTFTDCRFFGAAFPGTRFVECAFTRCLFAKDNLASPCKFTETKFYACTFEDIEGTIPEI